MKPPPFDYHAPSSLEEALATVAQLGDDGKVLAGGQSLVPLMNFRLAWPGALVDLNRLGELAYVRVENGSVRIGAMTRQGDLERSPAVRDCPLVGEALRHVGHPATRNRGTVGGSIAHADPAAELPAVLCALGGEVVATSRTSSRTIGADELFLGFFTTSLAPGEILTEVRLPAAGPRSGSAFVELARRFGDFALAGVAARVELDERGAPARAGIGLCGAGPRTIRARRAEEALAGGAHPGEVGRLAAEDADPQADIHGDADYRRGLVRTLTERAASLALARARGAADG
jgi:CO/xanthine dehydrogenase FAD-binding subunit